MALSAASQVSDSGPSTQLSFIPEGFSMAELNESNEKYEKLVSKIRGIDINVMTPLAAMNTLQDLIDEVRDGGTDDQGPR